MLCHVASCCYGHRRAIVVRKPKGCRFKFLMLSPLSQILELNYCSGLPAVPVLAKLMLAHTLMCKSNNKGIYKESICLKNIKCTQNYKVKKLSDVLSHAHLDNVLPVHFELCLNCSDGSLYLRRCISRAKGKLQFVKCFLQSDWLQHVLGSVMFHVRG